MVKRSVSHLKIADAAGAGSVAPGAPLHHFAPVWDASRERIVAHLCEPAYPCPPEAAGVQPPETLCWRDRAALASGLRAALLHYRRREIGLVVVPVALETLSCLKQRRRYVSDLDRADASLLQLVVFRIRVARETPAAQIAAAAGALKPWANRTAVELCDPAHDISQAATMGLTAIATSLPALRARAVESRFSGLSPGVTWLKRACAAQGAFLHVGEVNALDVLQELRAMGVRWISGPVAGKAAAAPGPVGPHAFSALAAAGRAETRDAVHLA